VQLDALRRARRGADEATLFDELGWAAGGDDGLLGIARALTAESAGFSRPASASPTQRIVQAVTDYLALVSAGGDDATLGQSGLEATEQLLRTSSAGAPVIDALLRVLRRDQAERTPALATALPEAGDGQSAITTVRAAVPRPRAVAAGGARVAPEDRTQVVPMPGLAQVDEPSHDG